MAEVNTAIDMDNQKMYTVDDVNVFATEYPSLAFVVVGFYLLFVKFIGPKYMENRPPYHLKTVIRIYNLIQIYVNAYILYEAFREPKYMKEVYDKHCHCDGYFEKELVDKMSTLASTYYKLKAFDLLDTVFMVLKKKDKQLSFLHLFHHTVVLTAATIAFVDKEKILLPVLLLNTFVHVIMYTYYFLSSFKSLKGLLWWKSNITKLQIVQFILYLVYLFYAIINDCEVGFRVTVLWFTIVSMLLVLFVNFYVQTYLKKKK